MAAGWQVGLTASLLSVSQSSKQCGSLDISTPWASMTFYGGTFTFYYFYFVVVSAITNNWKTQLSTLIIWISESKSSIRKV
jgi:hypothetical protein